MMAATIVMSNTSDVGLLVDLNMTQRSSVCANCTASDHDRVHLDADIRLRLAYVAVGFVGMFGNAVVIGVILSHSNMRRARTNVLIANQSGIDFLASMFIVLCTLIRDVSAVRGSIIAKEIFCRVWANNTPMWALFVSSTYNLVCITLERYSGICYPMRHSTTCSKGKTTIAMTFSWLIGPAYVMAFNTSTGRYADGKCISITKWQNLVAQRAFIIFNVIFQFVIPVIIIVLAYTKIVLQLRQDVGADRHNTTDNPQNRNRNNIMKRARMNVIKTLLTVAASFLVCWSPVQITFTMLNSGYDVNIGIFYHFTVILAFVNCGINPFIYSLQHDQFKRVLFRRCRDIEESRESRVTDTTSVIDDSQMQNKGAKGNIVEFDNVGFEDTLP